jgi:hypothetical protein
MVRIPRGLSLQQEHNGRGTASDDKQCHITDGLGIDDEMRLEAGLREGGTSLYRQRL